MLTKAWELLSFKEILHKIWMIIEMNKEGEKTHQKWYDFKHPVTFSTFLRAFERLSKTGVAQHPLAFGVYINMSWTVLWRFLPSLYFDFPRVAFMLIICTCWEVLPLPLPTPTPYPPYTSADVNHPLTLSQDRCRAWGRLGGTLSPFFLGHRIKMTFLKEV